MPLPVFPKNRRKSCVPSTASAPSTAGASANAPSTPTGTKSPTCPSSPKNSARRIVVHHQKKKSLSSADNNNSWHKIQKSKELQSSDFIKNHNHNAVIVKVAHRWYFLKHFEKKKKVYIFICFFFSHHTLVLKMKCEFCCVIYKIIFKKLMYIASSSSIICQKDCECNISITNTHTTIPNRATWLYWHWSDSASLCKHKTTEEIKKD